MDITFGLLTFGALGWSQAIYWFIVSRLSTPPPPQAPTPTIIPPPPKVKPLTVARGAQVMGASSSTSRTTGHIINDPDVWMLLTEGVFKGDATRESFCTRTGMTRSRWSIARQWLVDRAIIDGRNKLLIDKRQIKHGEMLV